MFEYIVLTNYCASSTWYIVGNYVVKTGGHNIFFISCTIITIVHMSNHIVMYNIYLVPHINMYTFWNNLRIKEMSKY